MSRTKKPTTTTNAKAGKKTKTPALRRGKEPAKSASFTSEDVSVVAAPVATVAKRAAPAATKLSGLDAAALVLQKAREPLNAQELVKRIFNEGLWHSDGKTPSSTLYAAMIREIKMKGSSARFQKVGPGEFAAAK